MVVDVVLLVLRLAHIVVSIFWVGGALTVAGFIEPAVVAMGPEGGRFMQRLVQHQRLTLYLTLAAVVTILSGLGLFWRIGSLQPGWFGTGPGIGFSTGALLAVIGAGIGWFVSAPTAKQMGQLGAAMASAGGPPAPEQLAEMGALRHRLRLALRTGTVFLVLAAALMAVARYLP